MTGMHTTTRTYRGYTIERTMGGCWRGYSYGSGGPLIELAADTLAELRDEIRQAVGR